MEPVVSPLEQSPCSFRGLDYFEKVDLGVQEGWFRTKIAEGEGTSQEGTGVGASDFDSLVHLVEPPTSGLWERRARFS